MGYIVHLVAIDPISLRNQFLSHSREDLIADVAEWLEVTLSDDVAPDEVADLLRTSIETRAIDAEDTKFDADYDYDNYDDDEDNDKAAAALYYLMHKITSYWRPCYEETFNGYSEAIRALEDVMPEWSKLLQASLCRGLFGLVLLDFPSCGWISPEEIKRVLPTFVEEKKDAYLAALLSRPGDERPWHDVRDSLRTCAQTGAWMVHFWG